jgi:hypothetical protein
MALDASLELVDQASAVDGLSKTRSVLFRGINKGSVIVWDGRPCEVTSGDCHLSSDINASTWVIMLAVDIITGMSRVPSARLQDKVTLFQRQKFQTVCTLALLSFHSVNRRAYDDD